MSWRLSAVIALGLVAGILLARSAQDPVTGTASWDALRAAGFASYLCLWISLVSGLAVRLRYRPGPLALTWLLELHRMSGALGLAFVVGHVAGLLVDPEVGFSALDVAVGVTSSYRPAQVALGALAMWIMVAVLGSTGLAGRMHYATWHYLHMLSFPAYALALLHGVTAGTDSGSTSGVALYATTASIAAALVVARLFGRGWVAAGEPG